MCVGFRILLMLGIYQSSLIGLWFVLATIVVQAMVLIRVHRRQPGYKVGVIDPSLGQESLFFRAYRTFWNSMENIVPLFGMAILALVSGYSATKLSIVVWTYAIARVFHMILYYMVATDKNPSVRSIFFGIGFLATFYLIIDLGLYLIF